MTYNHTSIIFTVPLLESAAFETVKAVKQVLCRNMIDRPRGLAGYIQKCIICDYNTQD